MTINYFAVAVCAVLSMVIGFIWYGPLFGKTWMRIAGADAKDKAEREKMQKEAGPLYGIQFVLSIIQVCVLSFYLQAFSVSAGIASALLIYIGFVIPLVAGNAMWNNKPKKVMWAQFLIQAGYQLILFVVYAIILTMWH